MIYSRTDMSYDAMANGLVQASPTATIYAGNPYLPAALAATLGTTGSVGISAYYPDQQTHVRETTDFLQSTSGWMPRSASEGAGQLHPGQSIHNMEQSGLWDWRKFYAAADVVSVNGTPTCRVLTDPTLASQFAGCQPLNLFTGSPATATPAGYAYATGTSKYRARFTHDSVVASISGSPFQPARRPGGRGGGRRIPAPVACAHQQRRSGHAEHQHLFRGAARGALVRSLLLADQPGVAHGSLDVKEGFAEVAAPLLKICPSSAAQHQRRGARQ
jgi:hypothetical protein